MSRRVCDALCGCADPISNPPAREHDRIELGLRAAMAIKAENAGLYRQRAQFTKPGQPWMPPRRDRFHIHFSGGSPSHMTWSPSEWGADA